MTTAFSPAALAAASNIVAPAGPQRRAHTRFQLRARGALSLSGRPPIAVRTSDISQGGVGLEHDDPCGVLGESGILTFTHTANGQFQTFSHAVKLKYTRMASMTFRSGVEFNGLSANELTALQRLMATRPVIPEVY